jgi:hypothetical protein
MFRAKLIAQEGFGSDVGTDWEEYAYECACINTDTDVDTDDWTEQMFVDFVNHHPEWFLETIEGFFECGMFLKALNIKLSLDKPLTKESVFPILFPGKKPEEYVFHRKASTMADFGYQYYTWNGEYYLFGGFLY